MSEGSSNPDFSLADGHGYVLDRSHAAACRLNLQFYLWKDALKSNVHTSIPSSSNSVIVDVAIGTGMWLMDVARELPIAQIDGFDIDLRQAPPQQLQPSNATLRYLNIFENVPDDLIVKYDFVNVRLLVLVIEGVILAPSSKTLSKYSNQADSSNGMISTALACASKQRIPV